MFSFLFLSTTWLLTGVETKQTGISSVEHILHIKDGKFDSIDSIRLKFYCILSAKV